MYAVTPRSSLAAAGSWILRCPQQPLGVSARDAVRGVGPQHAAELGDELRLVELLDQGVRRPPAAALMLRHGEMALRHRSHLRKMGDAYRLPPGSKRSKPRPHGAGGLAADSCVDLVENHRRRLVQSGWDP